MFTQIPAHRYFLFLEGKAIFATPRLGVLPSVEVSQNEILMKKCATIFKALAILKQNQGKLSKCCDQLYYLLKTDNPDLDYSDMPETKAYPAAAYIIAALNTVNEIFEFLNREATRFSTPNTKKTNIFKDYEYLVLLDAAQLLQKATEKLLFGDVVTLYLYQIRKNKFIYESTHGRV